MRDYISTKLAGYRLKLHKETSAELIIPELIESVSVKVQPGIERNYYKVKFRDMPDFNSVKPDNKKVVDQIDLESIEDKGKFSVHFKGYLNIKDTLNCVRLSLENPAKKGELRIFNQLTETFTVNELAERVQEAGSMVGLEVKIQSVENPRKEAEEHYYNPRHTGLLELGLEPNYLSDDVLSQMMQFVLRYKDSIKMHQIYRKVTWE
jgi:hypothetical protein